MSPKVEKVEKRGPLTIPQAPNLHCNQRFKQRENEKPADNETTSKTFTALPLPIAPRQNNQAYEENAIQNFIERNLKQNKVHL